MEGLYMDILDAGSFLCGVPSVARCGEEARQAGQSERTPSNDPRADDPRRRHPISSARDKYVSFWRRSAVGEGWYLHMAECALVEATWQRIQMLLTVLS